MSGLDSSFLDTLLKLASLGTSGICIFAIFWIGYFISRLAPPVYQSVGCNPFGVGFKENLGSQGSRCAATLGFEIKPLRGRSKAKNSVRQSLRGGALQSRA